MITLAAGASQAIQNKFFDSMDNPIPVGPTVDVTWEATGPATLSPDPGGDNTKRMLVSSGAVGGGIITAYYYRNQPGSVQSTEPYTVIAGPISKGVIVPV